MEQQLETVKRRLIFIGVNSLNDTVEQLKPVSRTTLSEQVALQLAAKLEAKHWVPGEKLPSEAELCKVFNVGRSTLRKH